MRPIKSVTANAEFNKREQEFVKELAPQYDLTTVQFERYAIRYVLDNVGHNDFMTYVLQQNQEVDNRRHDEADAKVGVNNGE